MSRVTMLKMIGKGVKFKNILANCDGNVYLPILHPPKIAPCDRALIHVYLAYLFLHSGQVLGSFKCYFKRKYLNLIDSNCDVDESCPWFFIGTVLATGPECIINIYVILGKRNLFTDGCSSICSRTLSKPARHLIMQMQMII